VQESGCAGGPAGGGGGLVEMTTHPGDTVGDAIASAFNRGHQRHPVLHEKWTRLSHTVGSLLPHSLLSKCVQRDGDLDIILRCMEEEFVARPLQHRDQMIFMQDHYMVMISEIWIGSVYETIRLIGERNLVQKTVKYDGLAHDLRLLRIPLEKHQIAADSFLKQPLLTSRIPPNNDQTDLYEYKKHDELRAHIQPCGWSARGSVMWHVIDVKTEGDKWLERREISDRVLDFWDVTARQSSSYD
jgi:hypothetical protein